MNNKKIKTRVLVQFVSDERCGQLHEFGTFKTFNEGVEYALDLIDDTVSAILVNDAPQWVVLHKKK